MSFSFLKENKVFLAILFLIFSTYLWLAWQPIEKLLSGFLVDDAFYYFKSAANLANRLGPTFDGEHLTNGYHPLWMGINAVIYYLFPNNKILPIHLILTLAVLFFAGGTLLCWKIISQLVQDRTMQILLLLAYALNPWNISNILNGLETSLALFLLILLFWLFLRILNGKDRITDFLLLGMVGGLTVLARLDYGLFLAAILIFFLFKKKYSWPSLLAFSLTAFLLAVPWFLYNYFYFGSLIPASGLAYTLINHRLWFYKDRNLTQILLWSLYNFIGTITFTLKTIGLPNFYSASNLWKSFWSLGVIFFPIIAGIIYFYTVKRDQFKEYLRKLMASNEWIVFIIFFIAYFGLIVVHGAIRWSSREWYFASFPFLVVIFLALLLSRSSMEIYCKRILLALALLLGISFGISWAGIFTQYNGQLEAYNAALWARDNLPANVRIAAFNSGVLGYFSERFIMNSDGLINNSAFEALKENRLWELFKKERIDYLMDYEITLTYRFKSFLGIENPMAEVNRINIPIVLAPSSESYAGSHIGIFQLK
ncbi:MAG: glycosyltransferase family 39 protein [bacterium]|nr:glycosyltransferase family 39 protein [bacterium]